MQDLKHSNVVMLQTLTLFLCYFFYWYWEKNIRGWSLRFSWCNHIFFCLTLMKFLRPGGCGSVWYCCMPLTYRSIILGEVIFRIKFCEASVQWAAQLDLEFASQLFFSLYSHWAWSAIAVSCSPFAPSTSLLARCGYAGFGGGNSKLVSQLSSVRRQYYE